MPLPRYQIRNEYSLADPELYKASEKDDPEALLEGVAMAGLVGVLRQLGDLAEFAAEIFHDLHEETEHNLISSGDLPRCVLDSYEECRGPPRLFLLDKFDVAGQREKKASKVKKKGSRWRNEATPQFAMASHAKLHQLFLEERIENADNDPVCLVKLKRRQLNESSLDPKSGKSYMEKFLETPSPEHKAVNKTTGVLQPLRLTLDHSSELDLETHETNTVSPVKNSSLGKETSSSSPTELVLKPSMEELNGEVIDREIMEVPEPTGNFSDKIPLPHHKDAVQKKIIDGEGRKDSGSDGDHSDNMTGEVDSYMDALTSMDYEMDTDNDSRSNIDSGSVNGVKCQTGSDVTKGKPDVQARSSDSQLVGISSESDDGNSSFKKGRSSFSYSDTMDNLADDMVSDVDVGAEVSPSIKNFVPEVVEVSSILLPAHSEMQCSSSDKVLSPNECGPPDHGEVSSSSCHEDFNSTHVMLNQANSMEASYQEKQLDEVPSNVVKTDPDLSDSDDGKYLAGSSEVTGAGSYEKQEISLILLSTDESLPVDERDNSYANISSDALPYFSNTLQFAPEKRSGNDPLDVLKTDCTRESCDESSVNQIIDSWYPITSPTEEQHPCSNLAEVERDSGITIPPEGSDIMKGGNLASKANDDTLEAGQNLECMIPMLDNLESRCFSEQKFSDILHNDPELVADPVEVGASFHEKEQHIDQLFDASEAEETREFTCSVDAVEGDALICDLPSHCSDSVDTKDGVCLDDLATGNVHAENIVVSAAAACGSADFNGAVGTTFQTSNSICPAAGTLMYLEESLSGDADLCLEELKPNEVISQGCLVELETQETNPADIVSTSCKSVSRNTSNLEDIHYLSLGELTKNSLNVINLTTKPASLELSDQESESKDLSRLMESRADLVSSPTHHFSEKETSFKQSSDFPTNQHYKGSLHMVEDNSNISNLLSSKVQTYVTHSTGGSSNKPLEYLQLSGGQDKQERYTSAPIHPAYDILPEATKVSMEEMPPLPPLPPMQWRIGRIQHVSPASQRELVEQGQGLFPFISQIGTDRKGQFGLSALEKENKQPGNPFLPVVDGEELSGCASSQLAAECMQPPDPYSIHPPTIDSNINSQFNDICLGGKHSNPSLPIISNRSIGYDSIAMDDDRVESSYSLLIPATDTTSRHITVSSHENITQPPDQFVLDIGLEGGAYQHPEKSFGEEQGYLHDISVPPPIKREEQISTQIVDDLPIKVVQFPTKVEEQHQQALVVSEGESSQIPDAIVKHGLASAEVEIAQSSNTTVQNDISISEGEAIRPSIILAVSPVEDENSNGIPSVKLPRPRNPLIDAVVAHDKSKLRKVTERMQPPVIPKVDERDSLLEQIRTKSFNLKPAVVRRPSIQGPKTNLRLAAILEKANAMRQALAGSDEDEDDDDDGWSDT
ncbi:SCAR, putative isoform 2 [Hibiscus syriacus]|uniref:Protein SCAR n=1 Tax=Hibiscus syriacus TaxID=106335 RepID=A0A6A3D4T5_HIBSY|nr:SCAR, putative isoform 2 [Hibiscus syriacus]